MKVSRTAMHSEYRWKRQQESRRCSPRTRTERSSRPSERAGSVEQDSGRERTISTPTRGVPSETTSVIHVYDLHPRQSWTSIGEKSVELKAQSALT
jgi:hypothetical protein